MKCKLFLFLALSAYVGLAQTSQTAMFRAVMAASNEMPPAGWGASGAVTVGVHVVRDAAGNLVSGSVDFSVSYQFPNDAVIVGMGIVNAPAGKSGAMAIAADITAASPVRATAGNGHLYRQAEIMPGDQAGLAALSGLLGNPGQYSVNIFTTDNPAGAMTGSLQPANTAVLMATLASGNATGVATVRVFYTGASYAITSGEVVMQLGYQYPAQVTFSAMRIYAGQGEGGRLAVPAALIPGTQSAAGGAGVLTAPATQIDMTDREMVQAVQSMLVAPTGFSVNVDTVEYPGTALSGQLRGTDLMKFPVPNVAGTGAASEIRLHTLRYASGEVLAGTVVFDVNYRLPAGTQITGLNIDGSVSAPAITASPSGSGNVTAVVGVFVGPGLDSLNDLVRAPENHTVNVLVTAAASAISAPLAPPNTAAPVVLAVIPIVEDKSLTTFAPGELVEIYGTNLAKVTTDLSGWPGGSLPRMLNGVAVALGGQFGRMLYVSPNQVDAELAFETPLGSQPLSVNNGNAPSSGFSMDVTGIAPALYGIVFKNADFSLVSPSNPAKAGEALVLYATGMGPTTPALATGQTVPLGPPFFDTAPATVTIGGRNAKVDYSIAAPPYVAGLYQVAVEVPAALGPGSVPIVLTAGGAASNAVTIPVQ
jgi:uncharacterized protein (TIGR03437 family)